MTTSVSITRVINPCALIEIGNVALLTDPFFVDSRFFPMNEPIGLEPDDLPRLDVILGGHGVFDHWRPGSMIGYGHHDETQVVTATRRMAHQARRAGFSAATPMRWGDACEISPDVQLTCVPGEKLFGGAMRTNNYVLEATDVSVFIGTEACGLEPVRRCARDHAVDIAILPIDGLTFGRKRLVMDAATAMEAAEILGARTLAPIHYSQRPVRGLWTCPSGIDELARLSADHPTIAVRHGPTGVRVVLDG